MFRFGQIQTGFFFLQEYLFAAVSKHLVFGWCVCMCDAVNIAYVLGNEILW